MSKRWFSSWRRLVRTRDVSIGYLHPPHRLRWLIERERARADRSGSTFAVVAFAVDKLGLIQGELDALAAALEKRLRITDDAGILDDGRVAVLLPETPPAGAHKVADDLQNLLAERWLSRPPQVYVYAGGPGPEAPPASPGPTTQNAPRRQSMGVEALLVQPLPSWKRALDVVLAGTGLVLLSPLLGLIAAGVKVTSNGPVLFAQLRDGLGGRPFTIYKFRTMAADAEDRKPELQSRSEQDGPAFKIADDPRVTGLGRWLRQTSLDELPQLWNVLRGEMSLVGPRPLPCEESAACDNWHRQRLVVTPGLTCIWQVEGRSQVSFAEWIRMDIRYIRSRTLWGDTTLLVRTIPAVLRQRGAY